MKRTYSVPQMQITVISTEDILSTSPVVTLENILYDGNDLDIVDRVTW